ncbi:MAG: outer membrane protein assembly factor BamE [Rhodobacteraceae bacterium]|nr:outer membrane protein assembly factor BamE [Paracoccaceae bacterium]
MARHGITRLCLRRLVLAAGFGLALSSCSTIAENHGFVPSDEELALVEVGKDTRETVAATLGRPSASGLLNDVGWFYVQSRWERRGAFAPREVDREVVSITFTEDGVVENVERFGLEDGKVVAISRRVTEPNIKGLTFLRQLFGSIGRLRADSILD